MKYFGVFNKITKQRGGVISKEDNKPPVIKSDEVAIEITEEQMQKWIFMSLNATNDGIEEDTEASGDKDKRKQIAEIAKKIQRLLILEKAQELLNIPAALVPKVQAEIDEIRASLPLK